MISRRFRQLYLLIFFFLPGPTLISFLRASSISISVTLAPIRTESSILTISRISFTCIGFIRTAYVQCLNFTSTPIKFNRHLTVITENPTHDSLLNILLQTFVRVLQRKALNYSFLPTSVLPTIIFASGYFCFNTRTCLRFVGLYQVTCFPFSTRNCPSNSVESW